MAERSRKKRVRDAGSFSGARSIADRSLHVSLERFLDSIVENLPNMIFVKDAEELRFVLFNRAGEDLLGHSRADMIGKNDFDLFPAEEAEFFTSKDREVLAGGRLVDIPEEPIHTRFKGRRLLHTKKIPIKDESGVARFLLGISEDITEARENERRLRQAERLASVGTLAAGVAHEINNPIGAILLHAQAGARLGREQYADMQEIFHKIIEQSERCGRIVRSILRFAKPDSTERWRVDVNDSIRRAERFVEIEAQRHGTEIALELDDDLAQVSANPTEIEQAVVNLLLNAIEAAGQGGHVQVTSAATDGTIRIVVLDDGPGMGLEQEPHVFDPFYTGRGHDGGTGLGLSIVRGIIESQGGAVAVRRRDTGGTAFVIELPADAD